MEELPVVRLSDLGTFQDRAKNFYYIRTEKNKLKTYEFNEAQKIINKIREEEFQRS